MNIFTRLNKFRTEIQDRILTNQDILKLLKYTAEDALYKPDISIDDAWNMVGDKKINPDTKEEISGGYVFFQPRTTDTIQDNKSILIMSMTGRANKNNFADVYLTFRVLVDYSNKELVDGSYRLFTICEKLTDMFSNTSGSWIGDMTFKDFGNITVPSNYDSMGVTFVISDFR